MVDRVGLIDLIGSIVETPKLGVSTDNDLSTNKSQWISGNLGVIINQYKRICTIQSRKINASFSWQS